MSEVLSRVQPYIHLEETMKTSSNYSVKPGDHGEKLKSPHEAFVHTQDRTWGSLPTKDKHFWSSHRACFEPTSQ